MMDKLFESFRQFVEADEDRPKPGNIKAYKMDGLLVIAKRVGRKKEDILSDIRAIEGITTVTIGAHRSSDDLNFSEVRIKIDTTPLQHDQMHPVIAKIRRDVLQVKGVQSFRIVKRPEAL